MYVSNAGEAFWKFVQVPVSNMEALKSFQYLSDALKMAGLDGALEESRMNPNEGGADVSLMLIAHGSVTEAAHCGSSKP